MNRKYRGRSNGDVRSLIEEHWADLDTFGSLAYEVQHRFFMTRGYKANVVGRLLELVGLRLHSKWPAIVWPTTEVGSGD